MLQGVQHIEQLRRAVGGTDIVHQCHLVVALTAASAELCKFQDHSRRHIIYNIEAHVLQKRRRPALPRTGQAGNNEDFHAITRLSYDFDLRLQPDAGSIQHPLLHLTDQLRHIRKGGPAPVDEEACVLFRHLSAAHGVAL